VGTISIWHLFIVLAYLVLSIVPILAASPDIGLARKPYALRTISGFVAAVVISVISRAMDLGVGSNIIGSIVGAVLTVFLVLWSVHRVQDIGWSKWWCLFFLVPGVSLIVWLVLLFKPGAGGSDQTVPANRLGS